MRKVWSERHSGTEQQISIQLSCGTLDKRCGNLFHGRFNVIIKQSNNIVIFLLILKPNKRARWRRSNASLFWQQKEHVLFSDVSAIRNDKYPVTEMKSIGKVLLWSYFYSRHHLANPKGWAMLMQHTVRNIILCRKLISSPWVHGKSASVN